MKLKELLKYAVNIFYENEVIEIRDCNEIQKKILKKWEKLPDYKKISHVVSFAFQRNYYNLIYLDYSYNNTDNNTKNSWHISIGYTDYDFKLKQFRLFGGDRSHLNDFTTDDFFLCLEIIEKELKKTLF